jgi:hypothetical protein
VTIPAGPAPGLTTITEPTPCSAMNRLASAIVWSGEQVTGARRTSARSWI